LLCFCDDENDGKYEMWREKIVGESLSVITFVDILAIFQDKKWLEFSLTF
jgi:hypothetical protein